MADDLLLGPTTSSGRPYFGDEPAAPEPLQMPPARAPAKSLIARGEEHPKEYYENMPAVEVARRAYHQFLPSAGRALVAIPSAVMNYEQTGQGLATLGKGLAGAANLYQEKDPEKLRAQQESVQSLIDPYTSVAGLKKSLAEDPFEVLSTAATPFGGAIGKTGQIVGKVAPRFGKAIESTGRLATNVMDPTQGALDVAKGVGSQTLDALRGMRNVSTGVPGYSYEQAFKAGELPSNEVIGQVSARAPGMPPQDITGQMAKDAFNAFREGRGDANMFSTRASNATDAVRKEAIDDWARTKGALTNATKVDVPLGPAFKAINDIRNRLPTRGFALSTDALDAVDEIHKALSDRLYLPANHPEKKLFSLDKMKQEIYEKAKAYPPGSSASTALMNIYHGLRDSLVKVAPDYINLMDEWGGIKDELQNIQKTLGTGDKVAANAEMKKFMSAQRTPQGIELIEKLGQKDPLIPYMVAGDSIHSGVAHGASGMAEKLSIPAHMAHIYTQAMTMDPTRVLGAMGLAGLQGALQSPSLMGKLSYGAGRIAGSTPYRYAIPTLDAATRAASPAAVALERQRPEILEPATKMLTPQRTERPYFPGESERTGRATGGRIKRGMNAQMLMAAVERAKANGQMATESILNAPDEHVVKALKVANENI